MITILQMRKSGVCVGGCGLKGQSQLSDRSQNPSTSNTCLTPAHSTHILTGLTLRQMAR